MNKKILFCYFDYNSSRYTPLDLAYTKAFVQKTFPNIEIEIIKINAIKDRTNFKKEAYYIASFEADEVVFFLDSVLWSMMFAWEGALYLIQTLKRTNPKTKIGIQTYKFKEDLAKKVLNEYPEIDYLIRGEPEKAFLQYIKTDTFENTPSFAYRDGEAICLNPDGELLKNVDELPSPYLSGVLDDFLESHVGRTFFMSTSRKH